MLYDVNDLEGQGPWTVMFRAQ